jgi:nickel-type superoxide dismutase maturation protease
VTTTRGSRLSRAALLLGTLAGVGLAARYRSRLTRYEVAGESMLPALQPGDWLIADRKRRPRPGDIVLARDPREPSRTVAKRLLRFEPDGSAWLEGDNAAASTDSRHFGPVPVATVEAVVVARYWPRPRRLRPSG